MSLFFFLKLSISQFMTKQEATKILSALADGNHPYTKQPLADNSICHHRKVINALQVAIEELQSNSPKSIDTDDSTQKTSRKDSNMANSTTEIAQDFLSQEKLFTYLSEFKKNGFNPTISRLGKTLVGSKAKSIYPHVKDFNCYAILENKATYNQIKSIITTFFEINSLIIEKEYITNDRPWEELDYFDQEIFNTLSQKHKVNILNLINSLSLKRKNKDLQSEQILLARQIYPRAYEPWTQVENELLLKALRYTNDLSILSEIFQRGEIGIKLQGLKLLYHIEQMMKKRQVQTK